MITDAGVDVLSLGGTKNGVLGAEAVVVLNPEACDGLLYLRKMDMQLASKMRFISAQLLALLSGDLWLRSARHANAMAARLAAGVAELDGVRITRASQANAVFAILPARGRRPGAQPIPFLRLGSRHRRGALDVRLGHHDRGRRRLPGVAAVRARPRLNRSPASADRPGDPVWTSTSIEYTSARYTWEPHSTAVAALVVADAAHRHQRAATTNPQQLGLGRAGRLRADPLSGDSDRLPWARSTR